MTGAVGMKKDVALIPTRAALGATMLYHGVDKLKKENREQSGHFFESLGIRPGRSWALATGIAETAAGALAVVGLLTRPAAAAVLVTQAMAIGKLHARNGFSNTRGGFEFNLALMAIAAALLIAGPGRYSTHEALEHAVDRKSRRGGLLRLFGDEARPGFVSRLVRWLK